MVTLFTASTVGESNLIRSNVSFLPVLLLQWATPDPKVMYSQRKIGAEIMWKVMEELGPKKIYPKTEI